ncbi:uncharacterized protein LOC143445513 isoform X3 [Clavelina lepadiformis]|uniref:uncharacterized protein LOC143445513 isoform X3 n=1 Tax=Clavelina lepadiformis TaxID=159417 RepID=UPI004041374F
MQNKKALNNNLFVNNFHRWEKWSCFGETKSLIRGFVADNRLHMSDRPKDGPLLAERYPLSFSIVEVHCHLSLGNSLALNSCFKSRRAIM